MLGNGDRYVVKTKVMKEQSGRESSERKRNPRKGKQNREQARERASNIESKQYREQAEKSEQT